MYDTTYRQSIKGKIHPTECRVPKNSKERKKAFLRGQYKEIEENNTIGKIRDLFKKLEILREYFMQDGYNKGQK